MRLFKGGKIPSNFHVSAGQEAAIVGACIAQRNDNAMTGTHRSHGHPIGKGGRLDVFMVELIGREGGICKVRGGRCTLRTSRLAWSANRASLSDIALATGCAFSAKVRGRRSGNSCFFGDGAVSQGTIHQSLNMASLWKLPVIYFCENNGYAITTSVAQSQGQPGIALRAAGYGMRGVAVNGQDVNAVHEATAQAVTRARAGPTLIVANTYRFDEHNFGLAVPGKPYRSAEEGLQTRPRSDCAVSPICFSICVTQPRLWHATRAYARPAQCLARRTGWTGGRCQHNAQLEQLVQEPRAKLQPPTQAFEMKIAE
ncbi:thiamine pyrophosphate-dependent dehydrogenase E1 component subunit alpha [Mesorhizobium sp. M1004]|uniref:thiamine pyrophosphate-dependent dehydrogenase E1 component subunit alpha n=1 Tax=Mesorhizobium sp. M1004 TaxID=2957046 RepID=UPI00333820ED